jgi:hypothetical protein
VSEVGAGRAELAPARATPAGGRDGGRSGSGGSAVVELQGAAEPFFAADIGKSNDGHGLRRAGAREQPVAD